MVGEGKEGKRLVVDHIFAYQTIPNIGLEEDFRIFFDHGKVSNENQSCSSCQG